jgi:hypothetical protein
MIDFRWALSATPPWILHIAMSQLEIALCGVPAEPAAPLPNGYRLCDECRVRLREYHRREWSRILAAESAPNDAGGR